MKKLLLFFLCAFGANGLDAQTVSDSHYVYGIDFTHAKVKAASESVEDFVRIFEAVNMLLVTEPQKYDFSKIVDKRVTVEIEPMLKLVANAGYPDLKTLRNEVNDIDCQEIVSSYDLPQSEGTGIVLIAKLLDKPLAQATYDLVLFDIADRSIIYSREVKGRASGFGLRNYWANSVHEVIKHTKIYTE